MDFTRELQSVAQAGREIARAQQRIADLQAQADYLHDAGQDVTAILSILGACLVSVERMIDHKQKMERALLTVTSRGHY